MVTPQDLEFFIPFRPELNPNLTRARPLVWAWIDDFGLAVDARSRSRLRHAGLDQLASYIYPSAPAEELALLAEWIVWAFQLDDQLDDAVLRRAPEACGRALAGVTAVFAGQRSAADTPLLRSLHDLWRRTREVRSPQWLSMFAAHMVPYIDSYRVESLDRAAERVPELAEYVRHRRDSVAIAAYLDLSEISVGVELPRSIRANHSFEELKQVASDHVGALNDIFSFQKELACGYLHNSVFIVRRARGCSSGEALEAVRAMSDEHMASYMKLEEDVRRAATVGLTPAERDALHRYLLEARCLLRGNLEWCRGTRRYAEFEHPPASGSPSYVEDLFQLMRGDQGERVPSSV